MPNIQREQPEVGQAEVDNVPNVLPLQPEVSNAPRVLRMQAEVGHVLCIILVPAEVDIKFSVACLIMTFHIFHSQNTVFFRILIFYLCKIYLYICHNM